jgi:hypothetical protein
MSAYKEKSKSVHIIYTNDEDNKREMMFNGSGIKHKKKSSAGASFANELQHTNS